MQADNVSAEVVDVDLEAIQNLECDMFDEGNGEDWGLDADGHQQNWSPYKTY